MDEVTRTTMPAADATIREPGWLKSGTGSFHDTLISRPILRLAISHD